MLENSRQQSHPGNLCIMDSGIQLQVCCITPVLEKLGKKGEQKALQTQIFTNHFTSFYSENTPKNNVFCVNSRYYMGFFGLHLAPEYLHVST